MKTKMIDYVINQAMTSMTEPKPFYHAAIMVKNGKVIGIGINSLKPMSLLGKINNRSAYTHAEIAAIDNYLSKNKKMRLKFNESKNFIRHLFNSCLQVSADALVKDSYKTLTSDKQSCLLFEKRLSPCQES